MSHLGRPKKPDKENSLAPVAERLSELLGRKVTLAPDCVGPEAEGSGEGHEAGGRRAPGKRALSTRRKRRTTPTSRASSPAWATCMSTTLSAPRTGPMHPRKAWRRSSRVSPDSSWRRRSSSLAASSRTPRSPFVAIIGGAKVSTKIAVLEALLPRVTTMIIGGGMTYTFLKIQGHDDRQVPRRRGPRRHRFRVLDEGKGSGGGGTPSRRPARSSGVFGEGEGQIVDGADITGRT